MGIDHMGSEKNTSTMLAVVLTTINVSTPIHGVREIKICGHEQK